MKKISCIFCTSVLIWSYGLGVTQGQPLSKSTALQEATAGQPVVDGEGKEVRGFTLNAIGSVRLVVKSTVSPTLQISSYSTGSEKMILVIGALVATGAGLAFVAPLATVPAVVGPLANTAAGAAATGVSVGEASGIDYLLGHGRAGVMKEVVASVDMAAALQGSLERFLTAQDMQAGKTRGELDVVVAGYGFHTARDKDDEVCSFMDVLTTLNMEGKDPVEDKILLGWNVKDDDIPPPYCTSLKRLLEKDGLRARQSLIENAEIAAAVIAKRVNGRLP
jgi:hypothetical protein